MKGIINLGNTCYFNSALQCLLQVPPLSNLLILKRYVGECAFTSEYQNLVKIAWIDKSNILYNPSHLLSVFREKYPAFNNSQPHDAQECLMCILDLLERAIGTIVKQIFYGEIIQETVCKSGKSTRVEDFTVHMLTPDATETEIEKILHKTQKWSALDDYRDNGGRVWSVAATRHVFWSLPKILILSFPLRQKVTLKEEIDLANFVHPESKIPNTHYELFAMSKHFGRGQNNGHYSAFTKHKGQWYLKDDDIVKPVDGCPLSEHHYLVFYKLK